MRWRHGAEYVVDDGELQSAAVEVRITLLPLDDPRSAGRPVYRSIFGWRVYRGGQSGVLANDVDPDGDTLLHRWYRTAAR